MSRWEPDASGRLQEAALALYLERGYDETTVAEIAARAGLTERTFFRYFADKREVLFFGAEKFEAFLIGGVANAKASLQPMEIVAAALDAVANAAQERRDFATFARRRHALILLHADLRERELIKLASLASSMAKALRARGIAEPSASLAAEAGIAVLKIAFEQWVNDAKRRDLVHHIHASLAQMKAVASSKVKRTARTSSRSARSSSSSRRR
jgi:AcrR family transcriptional regulator